MIITNTLKGTDFRTTNKFGSDKMTDFLTQINIQQSLKLVKFLEIIITAIYIF